MNIDHLNFTQLLALRVDVNNRISAIEVDAKAELEEGNLVQGFALKVGRKSRKITDEPNLVRGLNGVLDYSELYTAKLIGLPALEKALKAKNLDSEMVQRLLAPHIEESVTASTLQYTGDMRTTQEDLTFG